MSFTALSFQTSWNHTVVKVLEKNIALEDHFHYIFKQILLGAGFLNFEWVITCLLSSQNSCEAHTTQWI